MFSLSSQVPGTDQYDNAEAAQIVRGLVLQRCFSINMKVCSLTWSPCPQTSQEAQLTELYVSVTNEFVEYSCQD